MNKEWLLPEYGLSCVENYVIGLISRNVTNWENIFCESYMRYIEVLKWLIEKNEQYASFSGIPRIQETGANLGIVSTNLESDVSFASICDFTNPFLIRVDPEFILKIYNKTLWRGDHFVYLEKFKDNYWKFINDNPLDEFIISIDKLKLWYSNRLIINKVIHITCNSIECNTINTFLKKMEIAGGEKEYMIDCTALQVRDAIGISRVLYRRARLFFLSHVNMAFLDEFISLLDTMFARIEYIRIRGAVDKKTLYKISQTICNVEKQVRETIIEKMR